MAKIFKNWKHSSRCPRIKIAGWKIWMASTMPVCIESRWGNKTDLFTRNKDKEFQWGHGDRSGVSIGTGGTPMNTLDAAVDILGIQDIDFLKVDCEGFEYYILQGGKGFSCCAGSPALL